ncbi:hypothetical protein HDU67_004485, partial [Dinochytrium kinnereticum]
KPWLQHQQPQRQGVETTVGEAIGGVSDSMQQQIGNGPQVKSGPVGKKPWLKHQQPQRQGPEIVSLSGRLGTVQGHEQQEGTVLKPADKKPWLQQKQPPPKHPQQPLKQQQRQIPDATPLEGKSGGGAGVEGRPQHPQGTGPFSTASPVSTKKGLQQQRQISDATLQEGKVGGFEGHMQNPHGAGSVSTASPVAKKSWHQQQHQPLQRHELQHQQPDILKHNETPQRLDTTVSKGTFGPQQHDHHQQSSTGQKRPWNQMDAQTQYQRLQQQQQQQHQKRLDEGNEMQMGGQAASGAKRPRNQHQQKGQSQMGTGSGFEKPLKTRGGRGSTKGVAGAPPPPLQFSMMPGGMKEWQEVERQNGASKDSEDAVDEEEGSEDAKGGAEEEEEEEEGWMPSEEEWERRFKEVTAQGGGAKGGAAVPGLVMVQSDVEGVLCVSEGRYPLQLVPPDVYEEELVIVGAVPT